MADDLSRVTADLLSAIAAVTGQPSSVIAAAYDSARAQTPGQDPSGTQDGQRLIDQLRTRLGLSPAVAPDRAAVHRATLAALSADDVQGLADAEVLALSQVLRHTPELVPTLDRDPVVFPRLPAHQIDMWQTLLDLERTGQSWILVGGQMTLLHCLENRVAPSRTTDDGDIVLNVWTRRDALSTTSRFLRDRGFTEDRTSDGYGYRFRRDETTVIDVLLPEGLERQRVYPTTATGRPGVSTDGANQALSRTERVPVSVGGIDGHIRRPNLLGALVLKATAYLIDSRDVDRHAQDILVLSEIALQSPRTTLSRVTSHDRKRMRPFVRRLTPDHRYLRQATDREAVLRFLTRFVAEPT